MQYRLWSLSLIASFLVGGSAFAQPAVPTTAAPAVDHGESTRTLVAAEVEKQKLVAISVVVARNGKAVFEQHVGFEDREAKVAAGPTTMYRWASISKPVTATAAMQLVEAGKLDLAADVRVLVPEFPEKPWPITAGELLCHQGGVVHYDNGPVITEPGPSLAETLHPYEDIVVGLGKFRKSKLVCEPGTKYSYTTYGYMLLGAVVERAAGGVDASRNSVVKFWPLVRERIAGPAGMATFQPDYQWVPIPHRAVGYVKSKAGVVERSTDTDVSWKLPGGGFISTAGDLSRFSVALMDGKLVKPETFVLMRTAQKLKGGGSTGYGLGLNVGTLRGRPTASHSGSQEKTATFMLMLPEDHLSVVLMSNTEGASLGPLANAVATEWLNGGEALKPSAQP